MAHSKHACIVPVGRIAPGSDSWLDTSAESPLIDTSTRTWRRREGCNAVMLWHGRALRCAHSIARTQLLLNRPRPAVL